MAEFTEYSYGGRNYAFTDPVSRMFECPICQGVVKKAHSVKCCKKTFCKGCLDEALKKFNKCPLCRTGNPTAYENDAIDDGVNDFKVLCFHHRKGCEWSGHLLHEPQHRQEKCGYAEVKCENWRIGCGVVDERRHMKKHMEEKCELREVACKYCGQFQRVHMMPLHIPICPDHPVACINGCQVKGLLRKNADSHQEVCPEAVVDCPFAEMGCNEKYLMRRDVQSHTTSAVSHHLALVMKNLVETKQAMQKQTDAHKTETECLKAHVQQLQVEAAAHRTTIEHLKADVQQLQVQADARSTQTDALTKQLQAEVNTHKAETRGLKTHIQQLQTAVVNHETTLKPKEARRRTPVHTFSQFSRHPQ